MNNKTDLKNINGVPMMGSKDIADMTGKDHSSIVVRDIKNMLEQLGIYHANLQDYENKSFFIKMKTYNGREVIDEIFLNQDLSTTLVTGYSVQDRYKIIKRWGDLESGKAQPLIATQPEAQPAPAANHDILSLARVVAEATASATMKAVMEVSAASLVTAASSAPVVEPALSIQNRNKHPANDGEYVRVIKISWETTFSDGSCRRLIKLAGLPTQKYKGSRGLLVHRESFMLALRTLIEESTPPANGRKRWQHPDFGGFELHKEPADIFGEVK